MIPFGTRRVLTSLLLLLEVVVSLVCSSATPATNWTQYHYQPNPRVNGPPCLLKNNSYGWKDLKNPDGSLYTDSKRQIVVTAQGWDSYYINAYVAQYLLEIMGYEVFVAATGTGYAVGSDFYANVVDLFLEAWPQDLPNYAQMTQIDRVAVDMGATGYSGVIGLYVPNSLIDKYPNYGFDFWRFLLNPDARALLPESGSTPAYLVNGKPQCDGQPAQCTNGYYIPSQCKVPGAKCVELWAYDPGYSPGNFQRLIDSLNLMVTIKFLGWNADIAMQKALDANLNVFVYNWAPSTFVASNNITKVLFPATDPQQYVNLEHHRDTAFVTTDVPTIIIHKLASQKFLVDFPELQSFVNQYQILDAYMNQMLRSTASLKLNYSQSACKWVQENENIWGPWIPAPPKSVVSCGIGYGRYMVNVAYSCIICPPGTFNWDTHNTGVCEPCPESLHCPGGAEVEVTNGYWMPHSINHTTPDWYKCPISSTCCDNGTCPAETCAPTFSGILCTECKEPNSYMWNAKCSKCSTAGGASFYLILFGAFFGAVVLLFLPFEEAPTVEVLFFYFQVTYYIFIDQPNGLLSLPGLSTFLAIASLNIDGMVSDCTLPIKGVSKMMFRFFLPLLIQGYIIAIYFGMRFLQSSGLISVESAGRFTPYYMKGQSISLICFRATIVVLTFVMMPLIDASLLLLQCTDIMGKHVLTNAPNVECFGSEHAPGAALAVIILIIFLGVVPALIAYVLHKLAKGGNIKYEEEGISNVQKLFQCLYIVFRPEMYYMMPITMLEKGVTSILFTMLVRYNEMVQINVYILFLTFICATRIYWQPYKSYLEAYLNKEITLGILAMIAYRQFTDHYGVTSSALWQISFLLFLPVFSHLVRWVCANYAKHEDKIKGVLASAAASASISSKFGGSVHPFNDSQASAVHRNNSIKSKIDEPVSPNLRVRTGSMHTMKSSMISIGGAASPVKYGEMEPLNATQGP